LPVTFSITVAKLFTEKQMLPKLRLLRIDNVQVLVEKGL